MDEGRKTRVDGVEVHFGELPPGVEFAVGPGLVVCRSGVTDDEILRAVQASKRAFTGSFGPPVQK